MGREKTGCTTPGPTATRSLTISLSFLEGTLLGR